jgi:DNA polymerase III subunit delta'
VAPPPELSAPVPLPPVYGHAHARATLAAAARSGTLTQSLLVHGPAGIGKERLAFWIAALVMCAEPGSDGPCGRCRDCRDVGRLEHPDVHWFFPLPRPEGASTPEKLREKLEEARGVELAARRADPHHVPRFDRAPAYFLGTVLNLQRLAGLRPSVGSRKVFVVGDAEAMVPQESSQEAANAFLKLLEEPPADTTLVLTSSAPGALLPTIRSRVLPIRLLRMADAEVASFLQRELEMGADEAAALATAADGAIGRALRLRPGAGGDGALQKQRDAGRALLAAALAGGDAPRFAAANAVAPAGARGEFTGSLEALALWLRDLMATAAGAPETVRFAAADAELLGRLAARPGVTAAGAGRAILHVKEAQELAAGNVNPQLVVAALLGAVRRELGGGS